MASLEERYEAAMVLSGVGDALGYKNGEWEFGNAEKIHKQLAVLGGVDNIQVDQTNWMVSDDTVMHIATAEALVEWYNDILVSCRNESLKLGEELYRTLASKYKYTMDNDMFGRAPGGTSLKSCSMLDPDQPDGYLIPFNPEGVTCGAAMRSMCIGLFYPRPEQLEDLVAVSVESGRMTHHHPTGYLGALAAALFTSYSIQGKPVKEWGLGLMETLPKALDYVKESNHFVDENVASWGYFEDSWKNYLKIRDITDGKNEPRFPEKYGIEERDKFYKNCSLKG